MKTILVIDDEKDLIKLIEHHLSKEGFLVIGAKDGIQGLEIIRKHKPDLILLDIMLPGMDGLEVCKRLKISAESSKIPVIMLTAKAQETDKVVGLELGADDYITKPFSPRELVARVKAVLRRFKESESKKQLTIEDIVIDYSGRTVAIKDKLLSLTNTEFNLLWHLANNMGKVVSRDELISAGRGDDAMVIDRTIDVHIASLRKKMGKYKSRIETIRSVGYKFTAS
ncbi:MAG: response regulator transcription factor [Planctomycetes bacterium]|nr:response regulator transcription factor [Planctomycetota bacterium]